MPTSFLNSFPQKNKKCEMLLLEGFFPFFLTVKLQNQIILNFISIMYCLLTVFMQRQILSLSVFYFVIVMIFLNIFAQVSESNLSYQLKGIG